MLNNLEVINEIMILLSICVMHNFSDFQDEKKRYTIGWVYVWTIIATMILNLLFIGSYIVEALYGYLKKEFYKKYRNKTLPKPFITGIQKMEIYKQKRKNN